MKNMLLLLNPCSGKQKANRLLPEIISLFNRAGYAVTVHITDGPGDGARAAERFAGQMDAVVCCGGDGTFNETVTGLLRSGSDTPIGYIPCGSTNDFAAGLQLPTELLEAAGAIVCGKPQRYDCGRINDRYFTYVASFGAFTRSSYATNQHAKNSLGFLAYLLSGIQEISQLRPIRIRAELDGAVLEDNVLFCAVSNATRLGRVLTLDPNRVDLSDGLLELMLIRPPKDPVELASCIHQLQNQQYDSRMITFRPVRELSITCPAGTVWSLDGERYDAPATSHISILPKAIGLLQKG